MLMDSEIVLAFSQTQFIELNGTKGWVSRDSYQKDVIQGNEFEKKYMVTGCDICNASMALFMSEALHSIGTKFTDYRYCGDWLFLIEIALLGKVYFFPEVCNYFRGHKESTISKPLNQGHNFERSGLFSNSYMLQDIKDKGLQTWYSRKIYRIPY